MKTYFSSYYRSAFYRWFSRVVLRRGVSCGSCPFWRFHSVVETKLPGHPVITVTNLGSCRLDQPQLFAKATLGWAWRAWADSDWCPRHPLYVKEIVGATAPTIYDKSGKRLHPLTYAPGVTGHNAGGFNRAPSLDEAYRIASGDHANVDPTRNYQQFRIHPGFAPDFKEQGTPPQPEVVKQDGVRLTGLDTDTKS